MTEGFTSPWPGWWKTHYYGRNPQLPDLPPQRWMVLTQASSPADAEQRLAAAVRRLRG